MRSILTFVVISISVLFAQKEPAQEQFLATPKFSANGIIFSDHLTGGLYHAIDNSITEISDRPGSEMYFTLSSDRSLVGFKEIDEQGIQRPVIYDVNSNVKTMLHSGSSRVGQISFANDGTIAFVVEKELFVRSGSSTRTFNLGTYSNLAPISPNGNFAAYNDDADQLWLINLNSGVSTMVTDDKASYFLPQWSPDGSQLLFSSLSGNLFTCSVSNKKITALCEGFSPSWIDNSTVLFYRKESNNDELISSDLFTFDINNQKEQQITLGNDCFEVDPSFDTQTQTIYYSDVKRKGIYARKFLPADKRVDNESPLVSFETIPNEMKRMRLAKSISSVRQTAAAYFEMPYVHQVWDTPDWYNGHSACGATSSIMVIAYYNIVPKWNVWCSASGSSPGHYSPYGNYVCEKYPYREIVYSAMAPDPSKNKTPSYGGYGFMWTGNYSPYSRTVDYYTNHSLTSTRYDSNSTFHQLIVSEIDSGYPFTLCNGLTSAGHIVVVNGYDIDNRTLIVNDPYGNKNSGLYPSLSGKGIKYDWPGYSNGHQNFNRIYWGVSVRHTKVQQADSLVDDSQLDKGFFLNTSAPSSLPQWSDRKSGGYNDHFWWTRTKLSDTCFAIWTANLSNDGLYEVFAYVPYSEATCAKYKITAMDGIHEVIVNQKNIKNNWVPLGTFPFTKGNSASVRLGDGSDTVKEAIVFDAVKWSYRGAVLASVPEIQTVPNSFLLEQNYPNPFNPATVINYQLPLTNHVSLKLYDVVGREIATIVNEVKNAGRYSVTFDASQLSSGLYFYKLTAGTFSETKKMSFQK
jgi:hypothetical protein